MSAKPKKPKEEPQGDQPAKKGGKKKLVIIAIPVLLIAIGAGLWFGGILPPLLGMGKEAHAAAKEGEGHGKETAPAEVAAHPPVFFDLPEIVANLNAGPRRNAFIKLRSKLELGKAEDEAAVKLALPRLLDLFQTYLREMRPEELRNSTGTYRLREELIARADIAVAPAHIVNVLFTELLIQ